MMDLEKDIERRLVRMVTMRGGACLKWVCPGWAGVPDRIVLMPGGRVVFVELKRSRVGKLSPMQIWWGKKLKDFGFSYWVIWDDSDLERFKAKEMEVQADD